MKRWQWWAHFRRKKKNAPFEQAFKLAIRDGVAITRVRPDGSVEVIERDDVFIMPKTVE